jgi:hypothetical protein
MRERNKNSRRSYKYKANIVLNADPEMILCMDSNSKFVRVKMKGSVDKEEIRKEVCDVMEGTEEGFVRRVRKYHLDLQQRT